jgi:tetratricopeptide (TPR) repeat protein
MNRSHPAPFGERRFRLVQGGGPRQPEEPERLDRFLTATDPLLLASLRKEDGQRRSRRIRRWATVIGLAFVISGSWASGVLWLKKTSPNEEKARILVEQGRTIMAGRELLSEERYKEALDNFELAVKLDPESADAWAELGNCHLYNYQSEQAEEVLKRALALNPEHAQARHGLGNLYLRRGEESKAEAIWKEGDRREMSQQLARLYLLQGRFQEAEAHLTPLLEESSANEIVQRMAQAARSRHLDPNLRTLLEPEPTGRSSWADLGWRMSRENRHREASTAFRKAIAEVPSDVNALSGMGWALLRLHRPAEARRYFQRALWLDSDHMLSLNGMAHSFKDEGRTGEAISAWIGMTELYPNVNDGTPGLAWTYYEMRDYHQAAVHFARLVKRYPYDSQVIEALNVAVENIDASPYD